VHEFFVSARRYTVRGILCIYMCQGGLRSSVFCVRAFIVVQ
jgi:hypothetical protein